MNHKFQLTKHVREILELETVTEIDINGVKRDRPKIENGLIYKNNGEVAKIFRVKVGQDLDTMDKVEKQKVWALFREFLEKTKSEVQINLITNNYYADTYVDRIKKDFKNKQKLIDPNLVPHIKNFVHFVEKQTDGIKEIREFYITLSFDRCQLKKYFGMNSFKKRLIDSFYSRLSHLNKNVLGDKIVKLEDDLADIEIHNYDAKNNCLKFFEEETELIKKYYDVEELSDQQVISLYNGHFYENIYHDGYYYTILDYIEIYGRQVNDVKVRDGILELFKWEKKNDFTEAHINNNYFRILSFFEYPIEVQVNFWDFLISHGGNFNFVLYFKQTSKKIVLEDLERRKQEIKDIEGDSKVLGYTDDDLVDKLDYFDNIINWVNKEDEKMFLMSSYILLKEIDKMKMQKFSDEMSILFNENRVVFKIQPLKNIVKDFDIVLPLNKNDMKNYKFLTSTTLMNMYPFIWDFTNRKNRDKIKEIHK